jgi:hypothetical protein
VHHDSEGSEWDFPPGDEPRLEPGDAEAAGEQYSPQSDFELQPPVNKSRKLHVCHNVAMVSIPGTRVPLKYDIGTSYESNPVGTFQSPTSRRWLKRSPSYNDLMEYEASRNQKDGNH